MDIEQIREMAAMARENADLEMAWEFEALEDPWRHPEMEPGDRLHLEDRFEEEVSEDLPEWEMLAGLSETEQLLLKRYWAQMHMAGNVPVKEYSVLEAMLQAPEPDQVMRQWLEQALVLVREEAPRQPR